MEQITMVPLEQLHPHEKNPRIDAANVDELMESIQENGIRVPLVLAPRDDDAGWTVIAGHRRLAAAHGIGLAEVPAQIDESLKDPAAQAQFMILENIQRRNLSPMEESRAVQAVLDLGMTQAQVAKQTGMGKKWVTERAKLSKVAEETGTKIHDGQISITEALIIAEYSDDPDIVEELETNAGSWYFDTVASRARARREAKKKVESAKKQAKKNNVRVTGEDNDFVSLLELNAEQMWSTSDLDTLAATDPDDAEWEHALAEAHAECPGHCLQIIETGPWAGEVTYGCDQVIAQHEVAPGGEDEDEQAATAPEPEPEPDPLDRFTPEDLRTMRIDREKKVHTALTTTDLTAWATEEFTRRAVVAFDRLENFDHDGEYRTAALAFLGLPADASTPTAIRAFNKLPWPARYAFIDVAHPALFHHIPMSKSARAWMWTGVQTNDVDTLLHAIDAEPSELEKDLRTLRGNPWDKPSTDEDGAALAEGGDAA